MNPDRSPQETPSTPAGAPQPGGHPAGVAPAGGGTGPWRPHQKSWGLGDAWAGLGIGLAISASLTIGMMIVVFLLDTNLRELLLDEPDTAIMEIVTHPAVLLGSLVGLWGAFIGAPLWASYQKGQKSLKRDFGLQLILQDIWIGIAAGLLLRGIEVGGAYILQLLGADVEQAENTDILTSQESTIGFLLIAAAVAIGAPFFEEVYFRGLWLRALLKRGTGKVAAVIISSLIFGLLHTSGPTVTGAQLVVVTGLIGAALAVLALKTGRLGCSIVAHATFNLTAVILVQL